MVRLSRECRGYFFFAWLAWWIAAWTALYAEFNLRAGNEFSFYLVEAWMAMLAPLIALSLADQICIRQYQSIWFYLNRKSLGPLILDREAVDRLREELRSSLLLRWAAPPASRDVRSQLLTAALWLPALAAPEGTPWLARYREWLIDAACWLLLPAAMVLAVYGPARWSVPVAMLLFAAGLMVLGWSLIRFAARRQAILDYFSAWTSPPATL